MKIKIVLLLVIPFLMIACTEESEKTNPGDPSAVVDTTPDSFQFSAQENAELATLYTSDPVAVAGINSATEINIEGGEYSVDGAPFIATSGTIESGQQVVVRRMSSSNHATTTEALLTIGGVIASFRITTVEAVSTNPVNNGNIAFTDLISGPADGLGDGLGQGAIVTVWGWFGATQGDSRIEYCDSFNNCFQGYVYYWKNADGTLPSGPANLYASFQLQEVAFSIPGNAPQGAGEIRVTVGDNMSSIPFTIREGAIFHVNSTGNNNNEGSFDSPFATVSHAVNNTPAGSTIYVHDVETLADGNDRAIYKKANTPDSTLAAQYSIVSYPGFQAEFKAPQGIQGYQQSAMVVSKAIVLSSNRIEESQGQLGAGTGSGPTFAIKATAYGRAIGNRISDLPGQCASKTQGAIISSADFYDYASDFRVYGNEIHDYGCAGSSKLHHTTYFSLRSNPDTDGPQDLQALPPHVQFNYLHNNKAKNGIHFHDQSADCGDYTEDVYINNNVIVNQSGAGITYQSSGCDRHEDVHIFNNIILNAGLPADWDGIDPETSQGHDGNGVTIWDSGLTGTMHVYHNLIAGWNRDNINSGSGCFGFRGSQDEVKVLFNNNICLAYFDRDFIGIGYQSASKSDNIFGHGNLFYYVGENPSFPAILSEAEPDNYEYTLNPAQAINAISPNVENLSNHIEQNPELLIHGVIISLSETSPAKGSSTQAPPQDIYGNWRSTPATAGPVE
ncbi:MAG: hypothetical protein MJA28_07500 [Gammaproteobacteria bacterium]|nr:hypothetical protein [Gammaproteobacteria bacterium]